MVYKNKIKNIYNMLFVSLLIHRLGAELQGDDDREAALRTAFLHRGLDMMKRRSLMGCLRQLRLLVVVIRTLRRYESK